MDESLQERKARFLAAQKAREKAEKERKSGSFNSNNTKIPDYEYLYLKPDSSAIFRMLGESLEQRKTITDPIAVKRVLIKADDDSYFSFIYSPDKDNPFNILMRRLGKYSYDSATKTKTYANAGNSLLTRMLTNGKDPTKVSPYETGWTGKNFVLVNVIDRLDMEYHRTSKKTKILAWEANEKDGKMFYGAGMSQGLYKEIWDTKCTMVGKHFNDWDIVFHRYTQKSRPNEKTNYIVANLEEKSLINTLSEKSGVDYYSKIKQVEYLDEEDRSFEMFPLEGIPFISMPTPIAVVMNKLGTFIKEYDRTFNDTIWEKCVEWKEKEISALNHGETTTSLTKEKDISTKAELPSEVQAPPSAMKVKAVKVVANGFDHSNLPPEAYELWPGLKDMDADDWKLIKNIDMENQEIEWFVVDSECGKCGMEFDDRVKVCIGCATHF